MTADKSWDRNTGCTFYFTVLKKIMVWTQYNRVFYVYSVLFE